jgi:hypothetical protein
LKLGEFRITRTPRILANSATVLQAQGCDFFGTRVRKQFFHARLVRLKIFFSLRRVSQLQCKPEVRAIRFEVIDNVLKQLAETPLTRVLAGVKSATRLKLLRCEFVRL